MLAQTISKVNIKKNLYTSPDLLNIVKNKFNNYKEKENYYKANEISKWYSEWDFKDYNPNIYSHGFHQYPAKFIPQLARKLLRIFTDENSQILDIFCGSGTTLIESLLLNRKKVYGIELNPFAVFMAKVKLTPIAPILIHKKFLEIRDLYFNEKVNDFKTEKFYNINFWFKEQTILELSKLKYVISLINDKQTQNFFLLGFSEVIRKVSLTNHSGFKLHRDKKKIEDSFNPNIFFEFQRICNKNIALMSSFYNDAKNSTTLIKILNEDSRKKQDIDENSIDFILTSPPYGDSRTTVAYGQFSRLSWQWITGNSDIISLDEQLLGGKNNISLQDEILEYSLTLKNQLLNIEYKNHNRAKDVLSFYIDLFKALNNAYFYLKNGKYFVLVTGNRTVKDVFLRTDLIISEIANTIGFKTEKILYRNIINKRMPAKNSPTNEKGKVGNTMLKENIIFLRKI